MCAGMVVGSAGEAGAEKKKKKKKKSHPLYGLARPAREMTTQLLPFVTLSSKNLWLFTNGVIECRILPKAERFAR